jgi:hypothetical protein
MVLYSLMFQHTWWFLLSMSFVTDSAHAPHASNCTHPNQLSVSTSRETDTTNITKTTYPINSISILPYHFPAGRTYAGVSPQD